MTNEKVMKWVGTVEGLHYVPRSFLPMKTVDALELIAGVGVKGDRYSTEEGYYSNRPEEGRQITLFEAETLEALKRDENIELSPEEHRRNITTRNVPLNHLVGRRFRIGDAIIEGTRLAQPCRHIEQVTGKEIFNILINRGGIHAKIVKSGTITQGSEIVPE